MPIGPKITAGVRSLIATVYLEHTDWVAKQVMREVHTRLRQRNPNVTPNWPKLSAIQIELKKLRTIHEGVKELGQDETWSLGTLDDPPIHVEALPFVLRVWLHCRDQVSTPLTVRQAKWVARLYPYYDDIAQLFAFAAACSFQELQSELAVASANAWTGLQVALYEQATGVKLSSELRTKILSEQSRLPPG